LQQVAFPLLARLWAEGEFDKFKKLVRQIEIMTVLGALACSMTLVFLAELIIRVIAGPDFLDAKWPLVVHSLATLVLLCGSALRPALANMGLQSKVLVIVAISSAVFYATVLFTIPQFGIIGASLAHLAANATTLPLIVALYARGMRADSRVRAERCAALPDQPRE